MTQFTQSMVSIIKNFTTITNNGIVFPVGNTIAVQDGGGPGVDRNAGRTLIAIAQLENPIEKAFSIFDANELFSAITMFEAPVIDVDDSSGKIIVKNATPGSGSFKLNAGTPDVVKSPGEVRYPESDDNMTFRLTAEAYQRIFRGVGVVQTPEIMIYGQGGELFIAAHDQRNKQCDTFVLPVGETDKEFSVVVSNDSINKLVKNIDYDVTISPAGILRAKSANPDVDVCYFIAGQFKT